MRPLIGGLAVVAMVAVGLAIVRPGATGVALPRVYTDGCHLPPQQSVPHPCIGGDAGSDRTAYLFGDSHAAQWFPALDMLASRQGYRLISHTKSACPPWVVPVLHEGQAYPECAAWRDAVIAEIAAVQPAIVYVTGARRYEMTGPTFVHDHQAAWAAGMRRTLDAIDSAVLVAETPWVHDGIPYGDDAYAALESEVAETSGVTLLDPCANACPASAFRDQHHLTVIYSESLADRLTP